ncbi:MAG: T9SS type A sorting domain-containing protein [Sphingobacteriales bacterium]|jgi:hypothetical protein|nr:T9SS type A sorting domain-containing protein [Sphingobacteriales bacterium]
MKRIFPVAILLTCILYSKAQICGTDAVLKHADVTYRDWLERDKQDYIRTVWTNGRFASLDTTDVIIPVAVHIIHDNESYGAGTNLHDSVVVNLINGLNKKFGGNTPNHVNMHIQFQLACIDPIGNFTNGITRFNGSVLTKYHTGGLNIGDSTNGVSADTIVKYTGWPVDRYYNIYIVNKIQGGSAGYAYYPTSFGYFNLDGGYYAAQYANSSTYYYHTQLISHEMGHAFNLLHTFEGDSSGMRCPPNATCSALGDLICDTPPHKQSECGSTGSCAAGNIRNTTYNFLSYCFPDSSLYIFTEGQRERIRAAAAYSSRQYAKSVVSPTISKQPQTVNTCLSQNVRFSVNTPSAGVFSYQWFKDDNPLVVSLDSVFTVATATYADTGKYQVGVYNAICQYLYSNEVYLHIRDTVPEVLTNPVNKTACSGDTITLSVISKGTNVTYQWQKNGANQNNSNTPDYTINNVQAGNAGNYRVIISNFCGKDTSSVAVLAVNAKTQINTHPSAQTKNVGQSVTFSVAAAGTALSYQWKKNNGFIPAAPNGNSYTINNLVLSDSGIYTVDVINSCNTVTSNAARLTVKNTSSGIRQSTINSIRTIFPNPAADAINVSIQSKQPGEIQLRIVNMNGIEIYGKKISVLRSEWQHTINVSGYAKGMYILELTDKEGMATEKFLVE